MLTSKEMLYDNQADSFEWWMARPGVPSVTRTSTFKIEDLSLGPGKCDFGDPKGRNEPKTKARHFGNAGPDHPPLIGRVIRAATSINVSMKWCR